MDEPQGGGLTQNRAEIVAWVGSHIVPHEAHLRAWLRRLSITEDEINDIIQDAYVALARLDSVLHIRDSKAYFFQTAKSVFLNKIKRANIVPIDQLTELQSLGLSDEAPNAERRLSATQELAKIRQLIANLPEKCRVIFEMRRLQGVSQKEIAKHLGVSENVVEMQSVRGLKLILKALESEHIDDAKPKMPKSEASRDRRV
jgi:RNA polymerase sigma factor (sigma-70 family)